MEAGPASLVGLAVWCYVLSAVLDKRLTRWALRRADQGPAATARWVRNSQLRWHALWVVVWILGIALTEGDASNREAALVTVPMVMAYGPIATWLGSGTIGDLVEHGADPEVAHAVFRGGRWLAFLGGFWCAAAIGVTFVG